MPIFRRSMFWWPRLTRRTTWQVSAMSSLRDLQKRFVSILFEESPDSRISWIFCRDDGAQLRGQRRAQAAAQIAVYRNNLHEGFIKALALEFPVIERLVGLDYFRQ